MIKLEDRLIKRTKYWANRLGVSDYTFKFKFLSDRTIGHKYATVETSEESREATIEFNAERLLKEPEEVERTIVHELLHVRLNQYAELFVEMIRHFGETRKSKQYLLKSAEQLEHTIVVSVANALVGKVK